MKKMTRRVTKIGSCYRGRLQIQTRIRLIGSPLYLEFMKAGVKAHSDTILCTFLLFSADMMDHACYLGTSAFVIRTLIQSISSPFVRMPSYKG